MPSTTALPAVRRCQSPLPILSETQGTLTFSEMFTTSSSSRQSVSGPEADALVDEFCQLAVDLTKMQDTPKTSSTLEKQINQLTLMFESLAFDDQKKALIFLAKELNVNPDVIKDKANALAKLENHSPAFVKASDDLRKALTPPYRWLFANLGHAEAGVKFLVDLRAVLIKSMAGLSSEDLILVRSMNQELKSLLSHWFSIGLLQLEQITWSSPCAMLQKISEYEAVHPLRNWTDLKARVGPYRRCFAYTHRSMPGEPIVVLHIALTTEIVSTIASVVKHRRQVKRFQTVDSEEVTLNMEDTSQCTTAIFYSISSTQEGLQGIELGNLLIKTAVKKLKEEFPQMDKFSTLSPIPGFRSWLMNELQRAKRDEVKLFKPDEIEALKQLFPDDFYTNLLSAIKSNAWNSDEKLIRLLETPLMRLCAKYLFIEKRRNYALNPVANFHLRNGASMWRINWMADLSPRGFDNSCGMMVNYRYFIDQVDANSSDYLLSYEIPVGEQVLQLANQSKEVS